jgi:uncharacterized membrane protein
VFDYHPPIMTALIVGLAAFLAPHSVGILASEWRSRQITRMGERPYKLAYSAVSLGGFLLVIWGFGMARASPTLLWQAPAGARHATAALTVIAFILIAAAYVPGTRMKAALGHPMTAGVGLWAFAHLLSNGRLADVILFGAFLAWSVVLFAVRRTRDRDAGIVYPPGALARDGIAAIAGIVAALLFAFFLHAPLIGVRPF